METGSPDQKEPGKSAKIAAIFNRSSVIAAVAALAFIAKVTIAASTYGTNDALTFERDVDKLRADGAKLLYLEGVPKRPGERSEFSHSPFIIHALRAADGLRALSGIPVRFWIRLACAVADLISVFVLYRASTGSRVGVLIFAASPILIMVSGFHVNTDPVMLCALLACVYTIDRRDQPWISGVLLGLSMSVKVVPILFLPVLLPNIPGARRRAVFLATAALAFFALSLPYAVEFPGIILHSMLKYQSVSDVWGISLLARVGEANDFKVAYVRYGKVVVLAAILAASALIHRWRKQSLLCSCGVTASLFLFFTPGFGVQYLTYLTPWLSELRPRVSAWYSAVAGLYLFTIYTLWSGGFPWYFANSFVSRRISLHIFFLGVAVWITVGWIALSILRRRSGVPESRAMNERSAGRVPAL